MCNSFLKAFLWTFTYIILIIFYCSIKSQSQFSSSFSSSFFFFIIISFLLYVVILPLSFDKCSQATTNHTHNFHYPRTKIPLSSWVFFFLLLSQISLMTNSHFSSIFFYYTVFFFPGVANHCEHLLCLYHKYFMKLLIFYHHKTHPKSRS